METLEDKKKERAANGKEVAELKGEQSLGSDELLESFPQQEEKTSLYLEDHPMTCKWLITMVSKFPKWGCSPSKWPQWKRLIGWGILAPSS